MNDSGSVTSAVAAVAVGIPEPRLSAMDWAGNCFSFTFQTMPGVLYVTEYKESLTDGVWTELERRFGSGGLELVTDPAAGGTMRWYRVRAE